MNRQSTVGPGTPGPSPPNSPDVELGTTTVLRTRSDLAMHLSLEELRKLFRVTVDLRDQALFRVAYSHGLSASEVGLLRRTDIRLPAGKIKLRRRKGAFACEVPLLPAETLALKAWLRVRRAQAGPLFPSRNHRPISRRRLDTLMKRYCAAAGIRPEKAHFGVLRHSAAIHLAQRQGDAGLVCDWLGYQDVRSALRYFGGSKHCESHHRKEL